MKGLLRSCIPQKKKMKNYPLSKYRFYHATRDGQKQVIAVSTYAGRTVRGRATCAPEDSYDEQAGREIAAARCNQEIARRRYLRACARYNEAQRKYEEAMVFLNRMGKYLDDSQAAFVDAKILMDNLLNKY